MEDEKLRDALIQQLWRMNKMDIVTHLREFIEGELATLWFLNVSGDTTIIPSMISDNLRISRARTAIILRTLREKGYVTMDISEEDRRKMTVLLTESGKSYLDEKYEHLKLTADKEASLASWIEEEKRKKEGKDA